MEYRTTKAFSLFLAHIPQGLKEDCLRVLARTVEELRALPPGPDRARAVHQRVDAALARFAEQKPEVAQAVRCGKGCAHCCRIWVGVTRDEAGLLAERVRDGSVQPDRRRLERQRDFADPADFIGQPLEDASCAFLGPDGACMVYADRPSICRTVLMTSDPELCRGGDLTTLLSAVINPFSEVVVSAALTLDSENDPPPAPGRLLAAALLAELQGFEGPAGARSEPFWPR